MDSADNKIPPHRGEGYSSVFSGNIVLKHDGELTDDDVEEIRARYKCKCCIMLIGSPNPKRCLQVRCEADASGSDNTTEQNLTEAVKMAQQKILQSAEAKVRLTPDGRRRRTPLAPPPPMVEVPFVQRQPLSPQMMQTQQQMTAAQMWHNTTRR